MNPIAIYQSPSGVVEVRLDNDTVWLTQEQITQLFGRERSVITKHIRNVFNEGELEQKSVSDLTQERREILQAGGRRCAWR